MPFPPWVWDLPARFNIGVACTDAHAGTPRFDRPATVVDDDVLGVRQATFAELAAQTSRCAQLLRDIGVEAGDRILIRLRNCLEYPIVFLGALKRGAIPVPTSILLTAEEVLYLVRDSGAVAVVTDPPGWRALRQTLEDIPHVRHVLLAGAGEVAPSTRLAVLDFDTALAGISRLLKSFGYRVSPHEVERVLKDHPGVADAAVVGEEVGRGKVLIVAYVVLRPGSGVDADAVLAYGRERLASYKAPRVVYVVDDFPRTPNGKILRRALAPSMARAPAE